jgi:hypothetical protein
MPRYIVLMLSLFLAALGWADDSLRCGSRLITVGDSKVKVLDVCGEPLAREVLGSRTLHYGARRGGFIESTEVVERWTYDAGRTHFRRELTFSGGDLVEIKIGDKP